MEDNRKKALAAALGQIDKQFGKEVRLTRAAPAVRALISSPSQ
jgi:hypothetical protein